MVERKLQKQLRRRSNDGNSHDKNKTARFGKRKRFLEEEEIKALDARIQAGAPASGSNPLASVLAQQQLQKGESAAPYVGAKQFLQLPISDRTKRGMADSKFTHMTDIQRAAIPHALCGRDVLGAAKTGSGKTLAFLIPVMEKLFRLRWGAMDGVGALIISPTRELAVQIFEELRKVGKHHLLSGGLLIGGRKDVDSEKERVNRLNILVCTPGRLLQHMDETPNFQCSQLQVLVLDEADRILDMGFASTLNAIIAQLPKQRQTLLFSATQTRSVQDLARLSLKDPEYLAVHAESAVATPARLQQTAMIIALNEKIDVLWSFIKTHLHSKILVFLSSCKQVKFVYEAFKKLRPGVPLKCLHGRMKQAQRMVVFFKFCEEKHSVLFATDVAARGLDFPAVDWVVQVDCPEDVPSYIHRVGRTARYKSGGRSVIFVSPSEVKMLDDLKYAKIPVKVIKANQSKILHMSGALAGLLSKDPDLKYMAQRAFITYVRSIHLRADKEIFDVMKLPIEEFAVSLGLPTTPRIRFLNNKICKGHENTVGRLHADGGVNKNMLSEDIHMLKLAIKPVKTVDVEKPKGHHYLQDSDGVGVFTKNDTQGKDNNVANGKNASLGTRLTKKRKLKIIPNRPVGTRFVFDDEGNALPPLAALASKTSDEKDGDSHALEVAAHERYKKLNKEMRKRDQEDKLHEKQRLRERRNKQKQRGVQVDDVKASDAILSRAGKKQHLESSGSEESEGIDGLDWLENNQKHHEIKGVDVNALPLSLQESLALKMLKSR